MFPVFRNVGKKCLCKNYRLFNLISVVTKIFEKLVTDRLIRHLEKCGLFLISSMVLSLLDQLQIFLQLRLIESLRLLVGLGLLEL